MRKEELLDVILDSIREGVFAIDKDGIITIFNRAAEEITGFSRKEAVGKRCFDIFRADICQTKCALKETIKTGKRIVDLPVSIINKEGKEIPISISTAILRDKSGNIIGGVETFRDISQIEALRKELKEKYTFEDIVSKNPKIMEILRILPDIAQSDVTVLIQGPSGSGKELFAKAIHNLSKRRDKPYIKVNCAALPDTLLESELFGYMKGAFTDAKRDKPGKFAIADGGTILLDEVGEMSPALQAKLLRVLQEKEIEPLGGTFPIKVDVRVVAATNVDLYELVKKDRFRQDLYFRLNVVKLELPSLSERKEDIPLLVSAFIDKFNAKMGKRITGISEEAMSLLMNYDFPGNVRELENAIEHAFVLCKEGIIKPEHLPKEIILKASLQKGADVLEYSYPPIKSAEKELIKKTLEKNKGNRKKTARELGIDRTTLWRKMKLYGLL